MGVRVVQIPQELRRLAQGSSAAQRRLADGLDRDPRILLCTGWARVLVPPGSSAWTAGRRVLVRGGPPGDSDATRVLLLAHECVHVAQWHEGGLFGFLVPYLRSYFRGRLRGRRHWDAYREVPAEGEAFDVQEALASLL